MYFLRQKLIFLVKFISTQAKIANSTVFDNYVEMLKKLDKKLGFKGSENDSE